MLSIPIHIIGTKRLWLFTPLLAYIVGILLFCQIFLTVFIKTSSTFVHHSSPSQGKGKYSDPYLRVHRRSISSINIHKNESARRSHSTEIRTRHQNNYQWLGYEVDPDRDVFYPWMKDAECQNYSIHFAKKYTFKPR